jgi:methylene-tetrahydrofolate reductase-like protein
MVAPNRPRSAWPRPFRPRLSAGLNYAIHHLVTPNPLYRLVARFLERHGWAGRSFTAVEKAVKERAFGCQMCGQCALPKTGYACPQTCPKQLRNGPCGGVSPNGECEVFPGTQCVWVTAYERCEATGHLADLSLVQRPIDHRMVGSSSWVNYWLGRDDDLWAQPDATRVQLPLTPVRRVAS